MAEGTKTVIIKMEQAAEQEHEGILRVVGFAKVKEIIKVINVLDLNANPRESKVGPVTRAIQDSMMQTPELFPFKTKGILLGASTFERFDRKRYQVTFGDPETEGILDGGHNALAIGLFVLENACDYADVKLGRVSNWGDFKHEWEANSDVIEDYQIALRKPEDGEGGTTPLDVLVPLELLLPASYEDTDLYRANLLDICAARNNNVQLSTATKANKRGYFDALRSAFENECPSLASKIEWKTNDGGTIRVDKIVSLSWIPLKLVVEECGPFCDENGKPVDAPNNVAFYSGKSACLNKFERLMSSPDVSNSNSSDYHRELKNTTVLQALQITAQLPEIYDYIYAHFAECYNKSGGHFGAIEAVKGVNKTKKVTPFNGYAVDCNVPDGYIAPVIYGLQALMEVREEDGRQCIRWKVDDPMGWVENHLQGIMQIYMNSISMCGYDPQKVGKSAGSYEMAFAGYKLALAAGN